MDEFYIPDTWLRQVGFVAGNPFSTREAALEPILVQYFIPPIGFDELLGSAANPRSVVLVAERGCGKTTARRAVEWNCRAGRPDGPVLANPYLEFSSLVERAQRGEHITSRMHVDAILRQALLALLARLREKPSLTKDFTEGFRALLARYVHHYSDLTTDAGLDAWLLRSGLLSRTVNAETIRSGVLPGHSRFLTFLGEILNRPHEPWQADIRSYLDILDRFIDIAEVTGCRAIYVLVDRVDEIEPMASDSEQAADLLEPLTSNLPLMELDRLAFKLFVTPAVADALQSRPGIRTDRLPFQHISWIEDELVEMLDRRVKTFSAGKIESLDAVCASDLTGLVRQMAAIADGSPRNMLLLGEQLLFAYHTRVADSENLLLQRTDFTRAMARYRAGRRSDRAADIGREPMQQSVEPAPVRTTPMLSMDPAGRVWRGEQDIGRLPKLQHYLLEYLCANPGRLCTKDELVAAVYGEESASDEMLDKLVQRLRKRIEPDPKKPTFIKTAPGLGYVLDQPRTSAEQPPDITSTS